MMCRIDYDPDTTLEFDIKVKFKAFDMFRVWPITFFWFDISYHIWHMGVSP